MTRTTRTARLALITLVALALAAFSTHETRSDDAKAAPRPNPIEGAWKLVEKKNGDAQEFSKAPDGQEFINCITGGRFIWAVAQDGKLLASAGGKYKVEAGKYTETIEFVGGSGVPASFVGSSFEFTGKVEGDTWHKVGTIKVNGQDFKIDEKWERSR